MRYSINFLFKQPVRASVALQRDRHSRLQKIMAACIGACVVERRTAWLSNFTTTVFNTAAMISPRFALASDNGEIVDRRQPYGAPPVDERRSFSNRATYLPDSANVASASTIPNRDARSSLCGYWR